MGLNLLPGTEVLVRNLPWEVVESQAEGNQTRVRLRGTGGMAGFEFDILSPFEKIEPISRDFDPVHADKLPNWLVYHQAFLLEQSLGPDAFLAVQPGRLRIEPYQLVPLARALRLSRPRLLIADDVGLGKTIEAGLIVAELIARRRLYRLMIVTPAGPLLSQWQNEMSDRFGLQLTVVDRSKLDEVRRGAELGANPFDHISHALISMDFLKQDRVLDELERTLPYDLIIIDEAHHYNETGLNESDRSDASQRRKLAEVLARKTDALLLLTATPHDGYERSFASLLELLDPSLLDGKGKPREDVYRNYVIRRLKKHIQVRHPQTGEYVHFPERKIEPIEVGMDAEIHKDYVEMHRALLGFIAPALKSALRVKQYDDALAYLALLKRSTSSVVALRNTLQAVYSRLSELSTSRQEELESRNQRRKSLKAFQRKLARFGTLTLDEEQEKEMLEREELAQQLVLFDRETRKIEKSATKTTSITNALQNILEKANRAVSHDLKVDQLVDEIKKIRKVEPRSNILIYTEYLDSLRVIEERIQQEKLGPVLTIHGGQQDDNLPVKANRKTITERFRAKDNLILVSTDAAAEGLNLHDRCHHLIHFELPWNPNRLEQRNGRIDRYGQWEIPTIRYFYLCGIFEERILARLMAKYERQRARLKFMPNTLGVDVNDFPETGLFEALAGGEEFIGLPCKRFQFTDTSADESGDPDVKVLLEEIDHTLNRFENIAKTYKWLGDEGAAADQIYQQQAQRAFDAGQKFGQVDLLTFVKNALLSEGGRVHEHADLSDFYLPQHWTHGIDGLPGWNEDLHRLRLTTKMDRLLDDNEESIGYLGRTHPFVKSAIEKVRHQSLGQTNGLDRRVSAAKSKDGKKALLFTFLGRLDSKAGREFERLISVKVDEGLSVVAYQDASWIPDVSNAVATRGLWEKEFQSWADKAQKIAFTEAQKIFAEQAEVAGSRLKEQLGQERRDLEEWFYKRVSALLGREEQALPLFHGVSEGRSSIERLREFIALSKGHERTDAETLLELFESRSESFRSKIELLLPTVSQLGMLMVAN
jgi:ERCC4-related helicase